MADTFITPAWIAGITATAVTTLAGLFLKWKFVTKSDLKETEDRIMNAMTEDRKRLDRGDATLLTIDQHDDKCRANANELKLFIMEQFKTLKREIKEEARHDTDNLH